VTVVLLTVLLSSAAVLPSMATVTPGDDGQYEVAEGRTASVDPGREDDERQVFPINLTYEPLDHTPGATGVSYELYASGLVENGTLHGLRLRSADFDYADCTPSDTSAFGIDRGNDDSGTTIDKSLLTAYETYQSSSNMIDLTFYKESGLGAERVNGSVYDQLVAAQRGCIDNPDEPGWYRVNGRLNGSTKYDTKTDSTIRAGSQYTYICDCANEQEARETLGPPPNERDEQSTPSSTTTTGTPPTETTATSTPAPTRTAQATATPTASTTAKQNRNTDQPTASAGTGTARSTSTAASTRSTRTARRGTATGGSNAGLTTPTVGSGPGFGVLVALLALAFVALRQQ
jgi:hypothetical protein